MYSFCRQIGKDGAQVGQSYIGRRSSVSHVLLRYRWKFEVIGMVRDVCRREFAVNLHCCWMFVRTDSVSSVKLENYAVIAQMSSL